MDAPSTQEAPFDRYIVDHRRHNSARLVHEALERTGLITFDGVEDSSQFRSLVPRLQLGAVSPHRDSNEDGITRISLRASRGVAGYDGFSNAPLALHTDRSSEALPPDLLLCWMEMASDHGGDSTICDGQRVFAEMRRLWPQDARALAEEFFLFGERGKGKSYSGPIIQDLGEGRARLRYREDSLGWFPGPALEAIARFRVLLKQHAFHIRLRTGQGYLMKNSRWLHGRPAFEGPRILCRLLVDSGERKRGFSIEEVN